MIVHPQSELIREPGLLEPGRQPIGAVKLSGEAKGNYDFSTFIMPKPGSGFNDLVGKTQWNLTGSAVPTELYRGEVGLRSTLSNGYYDSSNKTAFDGLIRPRLLVVRAVSLAPSYSTTEYILYLDGGFNRDYHLSRGGYNYFYRANIRYGSSFTAYSTTQILDPSNGYPTHTWATYTDPNEPIEKVYCDGALESTYTSSLGTTQWTCTIARFLTGSTTSQKWDGYLFFMFIIDNHKFNDGQIRDIMLDPYQFLVPA